VLGRNSSRKHIRMGQMKEHIVIKRKVVFGSKISGGKCEEKEAHDSIFHITFIMAFKMLRKQYERQRSIFKDGNTSD
jgi:hypothetical protein